MGSMAQLALTSLSFRKRPDLVAELEYLTRRFGWTLNLCPLNLQSRDGFLAQCAHAEMILLGTESLTRDDLLKLPSLRVVVKYGVGVDNLDLDALSDHGIELRIEPGVNAEFVAEFTLGLAIALSRNIASGNRRLRGAEWVKNGGFNLGGKVFGVVGCGHVGSKVAHLARAFGCQVLLCDIVAKHDLARVLGAREVSFSELMRSSDIISLHTPLTKESRGMIGADELAQFKPSAILLNTARGEIVDWQALTQALRSLKLRGAAFDVFPYEPFVSDELLQFDNFLATPHIAGNSFEAVTAMGKAALRGVEAYLLKK